MKFKLNNKLKGKFHIDQEINELKNKYETLSNSNLEINFFSDLPLSQKTLNGLNAEKFVKPTDIQRKSIEPSLLGKDVVGSAITGSGKTLAFLIPILEHLYVNKWCRTDGIAAIIITPTRELAYQIFETLKKVGMYHDFSAGLIIGGKNLNFERKRMDQCNILICTPGRLLQHMDENPLFNASTMEILVLDEADRCLDMGFEQTLNAVIENFPPDYQTLLFSATQTNSIKDLTRLNLKDPVYIVNNTKSNEGVVPNLLQQSYVVVPLEEKITMLWSFIKNHLKQKIIVFLSSCKQVKYIYEIFCKMRPGTSLLALYGTLHQDRRITIYNNFVNKSNVVLFATDIASRGLDFPSVNWVVHLDCPEDVTQYIHRAGRSARNKARGESLLVLVPSEESAMVEELHKKGINIRKIQIDSKKLFSPLAKIEGYLAQNAELKASAQRAFLAYIKSVFLMKNKDIFKALEIDFDSYAKSLGLAITPRVRFLERFMKKLNVKENTKLSNDSNIAINRLDFESDNDSCSDDELIKVKRLNHDISIDDGNSNENDLLIPKREKLVTKAALAKKAIKKKIQVNAKLLYDDKGEEIVDVRKKLQSVLAKSYETNDIEGGIDIDAAKVLLNEEDKFDKQRFRELVKQRHKNLKVKQKNRTENADQFDEECDSDDEINTVDLSWLPDPKKLYNNSKTKSNETNESVKSISDNYQIDIEPPKKKKKVTSKLTLNDAEFIASQLLAQT